MIVKMFKVIVKQCINWLLQYLLKQRPLYIHNFAKSLETHDAGLETGFKYALKNASDTSNFHVLFNGKCVTVPAQTLLTMMHCTTLGESTIVCYVEEKHFMWLFKQVKNIETPTLFIDVGAASGAAIMTLAPRLSNLRVIAFEPSRKARALLERMLSANGYSSVEIYPFAVSDVVSEVPFVEYGLIDEAPSYRPETSSLFVPIEIPPDAETYRVKCVTLDSLVEISPLYISDNENILVKIDVEGFECHVLRGARKFIAMHRPFLAIDIHCQPENSAETTLEECSSLLTQMDYSLRIMDHVLLAKPNLCNSRTVK